METQLLVRMYNVGLGDCIYVRVPDAHRDVHILIDCGNKFSSIDRLEASIAEMKTHLEDDGTGKKRLDLLVVTHPHEDHHKGFEAEFFADIKINHLWLSPAYHPEDPKAKGFHSLQDAARRAVLGFSQLAVGELKEQLEDILLGLSKPQALKMLRETLPANNNIQPLYVSTSTSPEDLRIFEDPDITLKVLNPMADIDAFYLGGEGLIHNTTGSDSQGFADGYHALYQDEVTAPVVEPKNISLLDFQQLRNRMQGSALALADIAGEAANNLSVVLLLEWHGFRLLFTGDSEWNGADQGKVKPGRSNGSWNVMWQERKAELSQPLDFLKVGHHGSVNATPWTSKDHPINQILDHLLPLPEGENKPTARAVVSTFRTSRWVSIPDPTLLAEIGKRVANSRTQYIEDPARLHVPEQTPQPQRTDLEMQVTETPEKTVPYIDIYFPEKVDG